MTDREKPDDGKKSRQFRPVSLDAVNFLLSDVRGAVGPYLSVYLVTERHWSQQQVGLVTSVAGVLGLFVQTPVGDLIDKTHHKRGIVAAALVMLALSATVIFAWPHFWAVGVANSVMAITGDVFAPAIAALTLGLYARRELTRRMGRNSAFQNAGNVTIAIIAAGVGYEFSQRAVFLLVPLFSVLAIAAVMSVPSKAIDYNKARDMHQPSDENKEPGIEGYHVLLRSRPLLLFGLSVLLFQLANAVLLPLVGQKLALAHHKEATVLTSACIIAAQTVMMGMSLLVGHRADKWGRKPLLLVGFAALPVRAALFAVFDNTGLLIGTELLDGVSSGVLIALTPLVITDIMHGTGRYNVAQGAVATMQGIGGSLSALLAGVLVDHAGYSVAFLALSAIGVVAFVTLLFGVPETAKTAERKPEAAAGGARAPA